jgi:membrane associated rhomboid family serine protease
VLQRLWYSEVTVTFKVTVTYNQTIHSGVNPMQSSDQPVAAPATTILAAILLIVFGIELATHRAGNEFALLEMGALPANGQLNGDYWRILTYSFLHLNLNHLILNLALFLWVGRIVERRVGIGRAAIIYFTSVILGAIAILVNYNMSPGQGSAVGASAGIFGLLGAAMVLVYRKDMAGFSQDGGLRRGLWISLAVGVVMSFLPGVSFAGHLGGMIPGLILGLIVTTKEERPWFRIRR